MNTLYASERQPRIHSHVSGIRTVKRVPFPTSEVTEMLPRSRPTIVWQILNPKPAP